MKRKQIIAISLICICVIVGALLFVLPHKKETNHGGNNTTDNMEAFVASSSMSNTIVSNSIYEEEAVSAMKKVAENDYLELYLDEVETNVAVRDKISGGLWFSNPVNEEEDTFSSAYYQNILKSQLYITYIDENTKISTMNNYTSSIINGQFEIEEIEDGIRITYLVGDDSLTIRLPDAISAERMDTYMAQMTEEQQKKIKRNYTLYSYEDLDKDEKSEMLAEYPTLEEQNLYILRSGTKDYMREELATYFEAVGYTQEDFELDCKNLADSNAGEEPWFQIPLTYKLDGTSLIAMVNPEEIEYNSSCFYLVNVDVLRYFGASLYDDGYLFVPDGSGALINFNNGKTKESSYSAMVYGQDSTMLYTTWYQSQVDIQNAVKMPVYGIKDGEKAVFAIIEDGDAYATIKADVAGALTGYNDVYASFTYLQYGQASLDDMVGAASYYMYSEAKFEGVYKIRYSFLTGENANYSGMASHYREYLVHTGVLTEKVQEEEIPFYAEVIGAINKPNTIMGIKYEAVETVTTFAQAQEIAKSLQENGINNLNMIYSGWLDGGLHGSAITGFDVEAKLKTGAVSLTELQTYMEEADIDLFMTLDLQYVYSDKLVDGYTGILYAPRYFDNSIVKICDYGMASRVSDGDLASLISPYYVEQITEELSPKLVKQGVSGVNLGTLSWELYSDLKSDTYMDRQMAETANSMAMQILVDSGENLIADNANAYAWKYISELVNVPMYSNDYRIIDVEIPFYEMVIHGYISYAGEPMNLADDYETAVLKSVENGAGINFKWIYENNSILKETDFDYLYSVNYDLWSEQAMATYERMNKELGYLQCYEIISHEYVECNVVKVGYADGSFVYVNYTKNGVSVDGITIPARDYVVKEGTL